ncbi:MAG: leucyl aminopeptidase [Actinomycetota bacterium]|nr:leucyl aminopeptidase [Actinomycetota bacterium]
MEIAATTTPFSELHADLRATALFDGAELEPGVAEAPGASDAKGGFKKLAVAYPKAGARLAIAGIGKPEDLSTERLRVTGSLLAAEAQRHRATSLGFDLDSLAGAAVPPGEAAAAVAQGVVLGSYRFDRFRSADPDDPPPPKLERLVFGSAADAEALEPALASARIAAEAQNRARDLQSLPANHLTPTALAERASELAATHETIEVEVLGREEISALEMGGLAAVARGSYEEPRLITIRHTGHGSGDALGLVGKAVTFDSGGISIKPSAGMHEMKMDMSGGAAVIEAMGAIAALGIELDVVAVVPATENMPSGRSMRPGDVITQFNGKTVEINNTDAEGRLILADALTWCVREQGAARVVDLATLTGAALIALGSTYSALISNDDDFADTVVGAAERTGELAWRLPLHPDYKKLTTGMVADLTNAASKREAGTIYAGSFLEEFVDGTPWVHLDIAGTAWDSEREYAGKGPTGFGVRLLVALATELAQA